MSSYRENDEEALSVCPATTSKEQVVDFSLCLLPPVLLSPAGFNDTENSIPSISESISDDKLTVNDGSLPLGMDTDRILLENETRDSHSRRPSRSGESILKFLQEPPSGSPSKSQLSELARSIGSPNRSIGSYTTSGSSVNGSPTLNVSVNTEEETIRRFSQQSEVENLAVIWTNGADDISGTIKTAAEDILYEPAEKNGDLLENDSRASKRFSKAKIFPTDATGGLLAARDAFGPKLTPTVSAAMSPSFPETPTPGELNNYNMDMLDKNLHNGDDGDGPTANGNAGGHDDTDFESETLFFRDGRRRIDMVLVYQEENEGVMTETEAKKRQQRKIFQQNLLKEGLQLELEPKNNSFDGKTIFLKLHIPWKVKVRYAEVMNLRLCTKRFITISVKAWGDEGEKGKKSFWEKSLRWFNWVRKIQSWDNKKYPEEPSFHSSTDTGDREEKFVVKDRETAYTPAQRSLIVMQILTRTRYDQVSEKAGIRRLIADGSYLDCFPLHEGPYDRPGTDGVLLDRHLLYLIWARPSQWYKRQPLWLIRRYFGEKVALYFAWLGFYTKLLYAPAVVGLLCFIYGLVSMESPDNIPSKEICDPKLAGNITLCPLCDKACDYRKLGDSCLFSKLTYLFDNPATVFFAIFMSFWATTFLELWKRRQAVIVWEWDLQNEDGEEEPRPEFEASVKSYRINPVTREREPYLPALTRAFKFMVTGSMVFFMICVVLGAVLGTIIYRISLVAVFYGGGGTFLKKHAKFLTTGTAALLNLTIIMILTRIYHRLARWMTNYENPRTLTEYEDSYTFKIFLFEFVNFYSSLIYIAFFKGRFYVYPGDTDARSSEFFRIKTDVCDPAGCLSELCIQLAIIMIGKQCFNNFVEILSPKLWNWWRKRTHVAATTDLTRPYTCWEQDYQLQDPGKLALFDEYLEMVLQYGFVTLFVAAFPLAPLFALLNNIGEIRLDAYKMVKEARRPLAERVEDIGAWYGILKSVTYAAVVSNAFVIAYTSDFIPRSVYAFVYSPTNDLVGYIDSSLSDFNTSHYREDMVSDAGGYKPAICQYRGYRNGPEHKGDPYGLSPQYWHVFAARLAFVVVFEHVVFALTGIMSYAIPETPRSVATQLQRERLLAQEAKYEKGVNGKQDDEELLSVLRETGNFGRGGPVAAGGRRGSWARRFSKLSDGLDAHVDVAPRSNNRQSDASTVWEDT